MNTRSKCSNHDSWLSVTVYGGGGIVPSSRITTRFGPSAPRCSQIDAEPGPAVEHEAHRARRRIGGVEQVRRREDRRLGVAALVVDAAGDDRHELGDRAVLERAAVQHDRALAAARVAGEQLVELLAQALGRVVRGRRRGRGRGRGLRRFAHGRCLVGVEESDRSSIVAVVGAPAVSPGVACRVAAAVAPAPPAASRMARDRGEDALQQRRRRRRAAGHRDVDRNHVGHAAAGSRSSRRRCRRCSRSRRRRRPASAPASRRRCASARSPCASTPGPVTSSMSAWRGLATNWMPSALDVVVGVAERVDLELAAVARAGVDLADRQRAAERAQHLPLQPRDGGRLVGRGGAGRARS